MVATEAGQIVGSVWFTHGEVYVSDLGRVVHVPARTPERTAPLGSHPLFRSATLATWSLLCAKSQLRRWFEA